MRIIKLILTDWHFLSYKIFTHLSMQSNSHVSGNSFLVTISPELGMFSGLTVVVGIMLAVEVVNGTAILFKTNFLVILFKAHLALN